MRNRQSLLEVEAIYKFTNAFTNIVYGPRDSSVYDEICADMNAWEIDGAALHICVVLTKEIIFWL